MSYLIGRAVADIDTPALLVDLDAFERNIARMADWSRRVGRHVRPHVKAHKTPIVARRQLDAGAIGVTCAKLGEAEAMIAGGIGGILVSSEIVGPIKIARLMSLARQADVTVVVDDPANADDLSRAAVDWNATLGVLVEVNVGQDRCGTEPGAPAVALARHITTLPGLRWRGLQGYEGHLQHIREPAARRQRNAEAMGRLTATRRAIEDAGLPVEIVSTAGTGTCAFAVEHPGVTEVQPGSYIFMDSDYLAVEGLEFEGSLSVLTSVLSRQRPDIAIIDAGYKAISTDAGMPQVKGGTFEYKPGGDEHGKLGATDPAQLPPLGARLELRPSHCDTTVNLYDQFICVRAGRVEAVWHIAARGRVQ